MAGELAAVILAAGAGRRLGTVAKALLEIEPGTAFLTAISRLVDPALTVVVVADPHAPRVAAAARALGLTTASNPDPSTGMAGSIEVGFGHLLARGMSAAGALLWPVDHARVRADTIDVLRDAARPDRIAVPVYAGRGGHPTVFGSALWSELARCTLQPEGARSIVWADTARVDRIEVADPGVVLDVDETRDLRR